MRISLSKHLLKSSIGLTFLLAVCCASVNGQSLAIDSSFTFKNISLNTYVFVDTTGVSELSDIQSATFNKHTKKNFLLPFSEDVYWIRFTIENKSQKAENLVVYWDNALVEEVSLYVPDGLDYTQMSEKPYAHKNKVFTMGYEPTFEINQASNVTNTYFLKVRGKRGHFSKLYVYNKNAYDDFYTADSASRGLVSGLLIFRLLLVIILGFFVVRDRGLTLYSLVVLAKTLGFWGIQNVLGPLFSRNPDTVMKINFASYTIMPIFYIVFAWAVLPLKKMPVYFKWLLMLGLFTSVVTQVGAFTYASPQWLKLGIQNILFTYLIVYAMFFTAIFKKLPYDKFYSLPFIIGTSGYFFMNARLLGYIEMPSIFKVTELLYVAEIFLFIFYLGRIFRLKEEQGQKALQELSFSEEQTKKLRELDALKNTFFTNISHELRTPLTLIAGPITEMAKGYQSDNMLNILQNNVKKLQHLVDQILDVQKLEANKMELQCTNFDFVAFVKMQMGSFDSISFTRHIDLTTSFSDDEIYVNADMDKLSIVISNLLSNALKYAPEGGRITLEVFKRVENLELIVKDNGPGIAQEELPYIFDRFYHKKGNSNVKGTGIGLSLVKDLVALHHGKVEVSNADGAVFKLTLPIIAHNTLSLKSNRTPPSDSPQAESKPILLIVDDNADMRAYLSLLLEADYQILHAENGQVGLEIAKAQVPDIIITDLMMPVLDGISFVKEIRNEPLCNHIPIIMLTASNSLDKKLEGYDSGADYYLTKPFNKNEVISIISVVHSNREKLQKSFERRYKSDGAHDKDPRSENLFLRTLEDFLADNYQNSDLSVHQVAMSMGVSETQFRRKLKTNVGMSPNEYIRKYRLQKAYEMFQKQQSTVSEVAYSVGFENLSYFSKVFQEEYQILPSDLKA